MAPQTIPELDLLVAADEQVHTTWPTFNLIDVYVIDADGSYASLLDSNGQQRCLIGQLEPLTDDQVQLLKIRSLRRAPHVEIVKVTTASVDFASDELVLKVAGQAGWYNVQPSEAYQAVWKDMTMAVDVFRWLTRMHHQRLALKKRKAAQAYQDWPVEQLFEAYGLKYFNRPKMAPEAAQKIFKHKEFLLRCMLQGEGKIEWTETPLYSHIAKKFPKEVKAASDFLNREADNIHNALPIRSSASVLKRKHDQNGGPPDSASDDETSQTQRPASFRLASQQHGSRGIARQPETPKTNPVRDRRRYAMKGQSALRPSAVKPSRKAFSRHEIANSASDSEAKDKGRSGPAGRPGKPSSISQHSGSELAEEESSNDSNEDSGSDAEPTEETGTPAQREDTTTQMSVWHCSFNGCSHVISTASEPDLQMLSEEHIALHAYDNDARVRLVQQLQHSSLPVSHLMERVRHRARADQMSSEQGK